VVHEKRNKGPVTLMSLVVFPSSRRTLDGEILFEGCHSLTIPVFCRPERKDARQSGLETGPGLPHTAPKEASPQKFGPVPSLDDVTA
jgi:hypothetical protein